jgi:hypothetical protein
MQDVNVLVVFPTRGEWMERLALAAAVGAVQGRANIRLRCLEAAADRDFIAPRDADAEWADAIVAVKDGPADALQQYIESLGRPARSGNLGSFDFDRGGAVAGTSRGRGSARAKVEQLTKIGPGRHEKFSREEACRILRKTVILAAGPR